ncbi:TRAP transporter small permease subunit [Pseudorhodobacter sp.]|uniref:TRAP transporter small permease subunit n=1 Tax=Pseudorhodobacter sp. TaxID=1934400 RepID=UPI003A4C5B01
MSRFYLAVYRISQASAVIAAAALVLMVGFIAFEIVLRYFFSTSTFVQDEFLGYGLALCIIWSLGYTLENGSMIEVNLLSTRLSATHQRWLKAIGTFATMAVILGLTYMFWIRAARAWDRGSVSATSAEVPMWIPEIPDFGRPVALCVAAFGACLAACHGPRLSRPCGTIRSPRSIRHQSHGSTFRSDYRFWHLACFSGCRAMGFCQHRVGFGHITLVFGGDGP